MAALTTANISSVALRIDTHVPATEGIDNDGEGTLLLVRLDMCSLSLATVAVTHMGTQLREDRREELLLAELVPLTDSHNLHNDERRTSYKSEDLFDVL